MATKKNDLYELREWIAGELRDTRAAYASWVISNPEISAGHARRVGYLEASLEVIAWFEEDQSA
jgi:hypothetical protein